MTSGKKLRWDKAWSLETQAQLSRGHGSGITVQHHGAKGGVLLPQHQGSALKLSGGSGIWFPLGMRSSTSCKLQNEMMIHGLSSPFLGKTALLEKGREEKEQSREICHCSLPQPPCLSSIFFREMQDSTWACLQWRSPSFPAARRQRLCSGASRSGR